MYRKITFEQYKKELIIFFKKINEKFIENNVFWWAHSGTLLGSKRNEKFIPWDDDIDMAMTANEFYNKYNLLEEIGTDLNYKIADKVKFNGLNSSRLISNEKIIVEYEGREYLTSFFIDIMIAVPVKRESKLRSYYWFVSNRYMLLFSDFWKPLPSYKIKNGQPKRISIFVHILVWISRLFVLPLWLYRLVEKRAIKNAAKNVNHDLLELHYGWSHLRIYYNLSQMETSSIEGTKINITKNWEEELIMRYGDDYINPPGENYRKPKHFVLMPYNGKDKKVFPYIIK